MTNQYARAIVNPESPWWGHNLGQWSAEEEEFANLAVSGEYQQIGDILSTQRQKIE
jgi:hypothetical protein